ncbi:MULTISPECIES: acyl-CoA thioesterase [unclassified Pseudoclavibacter]|uniref:acyl-CoA thioesterase n=1 Tax=unclassified Pseudoclavibacter TaxID=2615177 RepID=UPI001300CB0E|nr:MULTISPECIES: acyl-CoA thioesterase II [unclassified Pseudoclavibacter]KAB1645636.1 acyl-CoA thioesterase II [Pseudoclavibacter sp. CFCC 14310]KAB1658584.1 acyl-CoA thioesterase II [Pseudoclavibacter sp. CFCC 11306]KAB1661357.1 acyl-CoA thioesterase II [Pseudoclavibacter sp. CFCC 13796]KAB1664457.1 acyl-CoA thioesterase II [Pseudoclavibacter sp. CFCC 13611]
MAADRSYALDNIAPVRHIEDVLRLEEVAAAHPGEQGFRGPSHWMPTGRVFGGQILSQALTAASRTVPDGRFVHSLHAYFLRGGDIELPVDFSVETLRDGRSFSQRRVQAYQHGEPILSLITSFQTVDAGLQHEIRPPAGIPGPDELPTTEETLRGAPEAFRRYFTDYRAFKMRHYPSPIYVSVPKEDEDIPFQAVWIKTREALGDDPALHAAALAYASDYTTFEPILRRHGIPWAYPGLNTASLDHAMWFHRQARADEWVLYVQESPTAQGGRGLTEGRMFTQGGDLIATVAQEGLVRLPQFKPENLKKAE